MAKVEIEKLVLLWQEEKDKKNKDKIFGEIYKICRKNIDFLSKSYCKNTKIEKDDLFQIGCEILLKSLEGYRENEETEFKTYLITSLNNSFRTELSNYRKEVNCISYNKNPYTLEKPYTDLNYERVNYELTAKRVLSQEEIRIIDLIVKQDYTFKTAGNELGLSRQRVQQKYAKAIEKLTEA